MKRSGGILGLSEFEQVEACLAQKLLLPREPLVAPGFEVSYLVRNFRDVGGDFLDYFYLADQRVGIYIGDVLGKGLPAAMFAGLAIGTMRSVHKTGQGPAAVLAAFNKYLRTRPDPFRFCATQYAVFDPLTRELSVANAGIPLPLHISTKGCHPFGDGGLPSGLFDFSDYEQQTVQLSPGDAVLFTTDGLPESMNADGEEFGMTRLMAACGEVGCGSPDRLLRNVFARVKDFASAGQHDDMSAVVLKVRQEF
jgi:phosphoserine phosphatase RsbU/P